MMDSYKEELKLQLVQYVLVWVLIRKIYAMLLMLEYQNHHKIIINKVEEQEEMDLKLNV